MASGLSSCGAEEIGETKAGHPVVDGRNKFGAPDGLRAKIAQTPAVFARNPEPAHGFIPKFEGCAKVEGAKMVLVGVAELHIFSGVAVIVRYCRPYAFLYFPGHAKSEIGADAAKNTTIFTFKNQAQGHLDVKWVDGCAGFVGHGIQYVLVPFALKL